MRFPIAMLALASALFGCGPADGGGPQTVLLVTVDTLRADHTTAFGYDLETTPALAALADRGLRFESALAVQPETGPSLASLMTSRHPREIGVRRNGDVLPADPPTLAEAFREAGFETAAFVSTYLLKDRACGLGRGFTAYDAEMTAANLGHDEFERPAAETADRAAAWLERTRGRRRFLWLHLYDPHGLYDPGADLARRFHRETGRPDLDPARIQPYQRFGDELDPDDYVARYDGEIRLADDAVGRVLAAAGEDAVVAFTADHGEGLGEHDYWFRHGWRLDTPALRVPLVLAGPGVPAGEVTDRLVTNLDLAPTLLALAGLDPLPGARGRPLLPAPDPAAAPAPAFAEARRSGDGEGPRIKVAVTDGSLRLVSWPEAGVAELFDLAADPGEDRDLAAERPETVARLRGLLLDWVAIGDRYPGDEPPADVQDALRAHGYVR